MAEARCLAQVHIAPEILLDVFRRARIELPPDVSIARLAVDPESGEMICVLESSSFVPCPIGARPRFITLRLCDG